MTSEDNTNVNAVPDVAADKPKRGRKRKVAVDEMAGQAYQVAVESKQVQVNEEVPAPTVAPTASAETPHPIQQAADAGMPPAAIAMEPPTTAVSETPTFGSGCGNVLKAAREAQGLSIHEVCSQLRLGIKQIQAIEQDDFDKLPQPSIVRGFIRNYARLLNIDVNPVLEAYQRIVPNQSPLPLSVRSNATRSVIDQPAPSTVPQRLITLLVFLVLAAVAAYFYINHIKPHTLKDATLAPEVEAPAESVSQEALPPVPETAPLTTEPAPLPPATDNVQGNAPVVTDSAATAPAYDNATTAAQPSNTVVSTPTPASTQTVEPTTLTAAEPQKASLVFKVREDSWVRIEDPQGKKLFSEVLPAGSERQVTAEKPVNITVGHASGTLLTIDNQPYDLTQATRGRVARIQLK